MDIFRHGFSQNQMNAALLKGNSGLSGVVVFHFLVERSFNDVTCTRASTSAHARAPTLMHARRTADTTTELTRDTSIRKYLLNELMCD